ncbi:MAG: helix-hairpin-helix domain-containing protein [bacterium]
MKVKNILVSTFVAAALAFSLGVQAKASKKQVSGKVNLNTASAEQIDQLPGISPKKAALIVEYRKDHPFKAVDELDNVKGFSPKSIDKIRPYVSTDGPNNLVVEGGKTKKAKKETATKKKRKKSDAG